MEKGYKNIFWGLFLATFNITIGPIKILPAFIGFLIMSSGIDLLQVKNSNKNFKEAYLYCNCLAGITFIGAIGEFTGLYVADLNALGRVISLIITNIVIILELLTVYYILIGSREVLELKNIDTINIREVSITRYIIIYSILAILSNINSIVIIESIALIIGFLMVIVRIWLLCRIEKLRKVLWCKY